MRHFPIHLCALILLSFTVAACETPTQEANKKPLELEAPSTYRYAIAEPSTQTAKTGFDISNELQKPFGKESVPVAKQVAAARKVIATYQNEPRLMRAEQFTAITLLNHALADGKLTAIAPSTLAERQLSEDEQILVGFATDLLTRNENHNASLLAASLKTLEGHWSEAKIRRHAQEAIQAAEAHLAEGTGCEECSASKKAASTERDKRIRRGVDRLKQLAAQ